MNEVERYYEDEVKDAEKYTEMAEKYPEYKQIFLDMAKEELLHSEHLRSIIEDVQVQV